MSPSKKYCGSAFEPGYLHVYPVLRLHLWSFRLYSARKLCGFQTKQKKNPCKEGYRDNVAVVGLFEEEEEGTGIASDVVKVEGEDPATPGDYLKSVDTRTPQDRNDSPISG